MDTRRQDSKLDDVALPPGTPGWVSEELIRRTIETWQPLMDKKMTTDDALAMLVNISQLYDAVGLTSSEEEIDEEVHRPGTGQ